MFRFGGVQYRAEEQQDEDEDSNMDENNLTIDLNVINDLCRYFIYSVFSMFKNFHMFS